MNFSFTKSPGYNKINQYYTISILALITCLIGLFLNSTTVQILPAIVAIATIFICWPKNMYFVFFGILPFSIEIYFSNGLGTDFPTEPIIVFYFLWTIFLWAKGDLSARSIRPSIITIFLCAHLSWVFFTALYADYPSVSLKFFLAKLWYVLPFFILSQKYLCNRKDIRNWIKIFLIGLFVSIAYVVVRHIGAGLQFSTIGSAVSPIYRNHVNYGALLTISLPLVWIMFRHSKQKVFYGTLIPILFVTIFFSFSRAAFVTIALIFCASVLLRIKLLAWTTAIAILASAATIVIISVDNKYLELAPKYESTIAHNKFESLVEATYRMEDISTMERLHRWIAGFQMLKERPIVGFGPNNFYFSYQPYTNNSFQTYVSDNPDRSGIHNYFLMTAVEQGIIGLVIFLAFIMSLLWKGERCFHQMGNGFNKDLMHMSLMMIVAVLGLNLINDLLEAVKIGPFFFIAAGMILRMEQLQKRDRQKEASTP